MKFIVKIQVCAILECYSTNINGMWNARKLGAIYKVFEFISMKVSQNLKLM